MITLPASDGQMAIQHGFHQGADRRNPKRGEGRHPPLVTGFFKALINGNGEIVMVKEELLTTECM